MYLCVKFQSQFVIGTITVDEIASPPENILLPFLFDNAFVEAPAEPMNEIPSDVSPPVATYVVG